VTNARHGAVKTDGDDYISSKKNPVMHGCGIEIARKIAEKHKGLVSFEHTDDSFSAEATLRVE
jgi:light-regulated signal transduction histidine kinase (bacteriophytochrome)